MPRVKNGRFQNPNLEVSSHAREPECGPSGFAGFIWRRIKDSNQRNLPAGHVLSTEEVLAGIEKHYPNNALTWLGHAAFLIRLANKNILTDPFLSDVAAPWPLRSPRRYAPPGLSAKQLPNIDLLLISHNHYDHLDDPTIKTLRERADTPVVVPLGLGRFFRERNYTQVTELNWWQSCNIDGLTITAVPAIHFSRRGPGDANKTLWCGYVIEDLQGYRLYFVGDTAYSPVFKQIGDEFKSIDCVLVPIGAYEPRAIMKRAHVNPEEAANLCVDVNAQQAVAMHWGSIVLTEEPAFEPPEKFRQAMQAAQYPLTAVHIPAVGETRALVSTN